MTISQVLRLIRGRGAFISAAVLVAVSLSMMTGQWLWGARDADAQPVEITIPEGTGAAAVARILAREDIVRHWLGFSIYATVTGRATSLQAGRYQLCACQSVPELVDAIASGKALSDDIQVTIPEGSNIWELDRILLRQDLLPLAGEFSRAYYHDEGSLFPDTYRIPKGATVIDIAERMRAEFAERADAYTLEQIILASLLEKEAKSADDMALVAGIMYRRLEMGMALQIDATVAYGWCVKTFGFQKFCDVTQAPIAKEIKIDGPYNTYTRTGLPAGAISNPGLQALQAVAHPKDSSYLYYLSTRDGSQIIYSKTHEEHLRNRAKYLGF